MQTRIAFMSGLMLGAALLFFTVEVFGGRYTYFTVPGDACHLIRQTAEIVPHQPNPCHFRRPRWDILP